MKISWDSEVDNACTELQSGYNKEDTELIVDCFLSFSQIDKILCTLERYPRNITTLSLKGDMSIYSWQSKNDGDRTFVFYYQLPFITDLTLKFMNHSTRQFSQLPH